MLLKDDEHLSKFDAKDDECIFLGYLLESKAYRMYVIDSHKFMKSLNETFDATKLPSIQREDCSDSLDFEDHSNDTYDPKVNPHGDDNSSNIGSGTDSGGDSENAIHTKTATETTRQGA